uniref:Cytochrome c oxidase subunit 2 n=1 Tax=Pharyngocirrus uchidai TaxID=2498818 RepID=A0A7G9IX09_9ANNE|nr:cytochrome c oxidase subunit II [Pharyngocirrus uchidai]QNM39903.1 cytochrome c oxidase subunit II [Pharyngocirrus uchidai]
MSNWDQLNFQDAASPIMSQLIMFHDHAMIILTLVISLVAYAMAALMANSLSSRYIFEAQEIETIWTVLPAITLLFLALPSLRLLYLMDEVSSPAVTLKTVGHQWYWSYEYSDFLNLEFDSYMLPTDELESGQFRLLEVDHRAVLPMHSEIRVLVTAADVIHSWTVPSLGVKADAIPGRLNQLGFIMNRPGVFYGQCSEICGANHSFMPIVIESVDTPSFSNWVSNFSE